MLIWIPVGKGRLSVRGRPGKKFWKVAPDEGVTRVVTLLSAREGVEDIGQQVSNLGLMWTWLPLENANIPTDETLKTLRTELPKLAARLLDGESIVIHCAAGIHRTGMIANALLRLCGLEADAAREQLMKMRVETGEGVGEARLAWGDEFTMGIRAMESG